MHTFVYSTERVRFVDMIKSLDKGNETERIFNFVDKILVNTISNPQTPGIGNV